MEKFGSGIQDKHSGSASLNRSLSFISRLVGFGPRARPCAARTRLFELIASPNGALRPPPYPSIAAMKYENPCPPPRPSQLRYSFRQYFGVKDLKLCTGATIRPTFSGFLFYIFLIFSFCYSLRFLLSFSISSYSSLLILLILFLLILLAGAILRLLFFSFYILNCLLYYRHEY
jgi:hypothetical protein